MSRLLKTRRGHDSEDEYSDADTEDMKSYISTDIDQSIHSISEIEQSDFYTDEELANENHSEKEEEDEEEEEEEEPEEAKDNDDNVTLLQKQVVDQENTQDKINCSSADHEEKNDIATPAKDDTPVQVEEIDYEATKEKRIQEHREYRRKLAEDPSFVPYVGLFWSHDDRYRDDAFSETRAAGSNNTNENASSAPYFSSSQHGNRGNFDRSLDPLMYKKWDHSGYEELLRLDEKEERLKRKMIEKGHNENYIQNRFAQRGRGNRGGRGGYLNHGQRYHNFNNNHHYRNKTYQQRQQKNTSEEWPELSTNATTSAAAIENHAWATATPDLLQEHENKPAVGILVDVDDSHAEVQPIEKKEPGSFNTSSNAEIAVNAWGSINRAEEIETIQKSSTVSGRGETEVNSLDNWETIDKEVKIAPSDGWGNPESTTASGWNADTNITPKSSSNNMTVNWTASNEATSTMQVMSSWDNIDKSIHSINGWTKSKKKEPVAHQFMDAESEIGEPTIPIEEKASNSWAEMSANAEPEKLYSSASHERSFAPRTRNNYEESNSRGVYRRQEDRGVNKQYSNNTRLLITKQQNDNWDPTTESTGWTQTTTSTDQNEVSGDSWGDVDATVIKDASGWGQTSTFFDSTKKKFKPKAPFTASQEDSTSAVRTSASGWATSTDYSEIATSGRNSSPAPAEPFTSSGWGASFAPAETSNSGWDSPSTPAASSTPVKPLTASSWGESPASALASESSTVDKDTTLIASTNIITSSKSPTSERDSPAPVESSNSGRGSSSAVADTSAGWDSSSIPVETSNSGWSASPATCETSTSNWGNNSEQSTKPRQNGWSTSQSSSSTNWNADKKARMNRKNIDQPRKGRGYLSQKLETTPSPSVEVLPVTATNEQHQPLGDSDSDVEIILEADEEPDWVKNEQILGMTAPGEDPPAPVSVIAEEESPKLRGSNFSRNYDSSSPQPEVPYRSNTKHYNSQRKTRRNFDENWRQRDDVSSDSENRPTNVPMYYPQPHHHMNTGNITYLPMIPNGPNGTPMYAMPFPMGMPSSPIAGSASPNNSVGGSDSSPHINNSSVKFYPPMVSGPNGLQLPPGYEANGMVYYGMDPSSMYAPPQPVYYYGPPMPGNMPPMFSPQQRASPNNQLNEDDLVEDGWGPSPDVHNSEEQWNSPHNNKSSTSGNHHQSSAYYIYSHQQ